MESVVLALLMLADADTSPAPTISSDPMTTVPVASACRTVVIAMDLNTIPSDTNLSLATVVVGPTVAAKRRSTATVVEVALTKLVKGRVIFSAALVRLLSTVKSMSRVCPKPSTTLRLVQVLSMETATSANAAPND